MFTTLEGEWDEVMAVVKQAVDVVAARSPRVGLVLKADIRPGHTGQLTAKLEGLGLTPAQVEAVTALSREIVERVVWEVVPVLAETIIKEELARLTK
jgi:hypothetical protein